MLPPSPQLVESTGDVYPACAKPNQPRQGSNEQATQCQPRSCSRPGRPRPWAWPASGHGRHGRHGPPRASAPPAIPGDTSGCRNTQCMQTERGCVSMDCLPGGGRRRAGDSGERAGQRLHGALTGVYPLVDHDQNHAGEAQPEARAQPLGLGGGLRRSGRGRVDRGRRCPCVHERARATG